MAAREYEKRKPVYVFSKKSFFCPVCDRRVHIGTRTHPYCFVEFDWNEHALDTKRMFNIRRILLPRALNPETIAERTNYHINTIYNIMLGRSTMNPAVRDYFIKMLPDHIANLQKFLRILEKGVLNEVVAEQEEQDAKQPKTRKKDPK